VIPKADEPEVDEDPVDPEEPEEVPIEGITAMISQKNLEPNVIEINQFSNNDVVIISCQNSKIYDLDF
jgi:hypothetical protein